MSETKRRHDVINRTKNLTKQQEKHLLNIINTDIDVTSTSNRNGTFVDLNKISMETIAKLELYLLDIDHCGFDTPPQPARQASDLSVFKYNNKYDPMFRLMSDAQKNAINDDAK